MSWTYYKFYHGATWESAVKEIHMVHTSPFPAADWMNRQDNKTPEYLKQNFPGAFNTNMWVFTNSASAVTALQSLGFTDVTFLGGATQRYWVNANQYIEVVPGSPPYFTIYTISPATSYSLGLSFLYASSVSTMPFVTSNSTSERMSISPGSTTLSCMFNNGNYGAQLLAWWQGVRPYVEPADPYEKLEVPDSGPGGGTGIGYDNIINDDIDFPSTPTASAVNANFISIWTPTLDQIQTLAAWMWTTDPLKWEFWQKLLQNPLELIFSLTIMPIPIFHTDESGTPAEGEIEAHKDVLSLGWQDTGIQMDWITDQYVTLDMGTIDMEEVWGAFLDYEPYTKIDIFLPYIGMKSLDTNDCMPRTISLRYVIDLATGTCIALIKCDNSVYYHFSGNCASQIPITVNQCQEIVRGLMTMAVGAATFALSGPVGAGAHASKAAITKSAAMKAGGAAMAGAGADNAAKGVTVSRSGTIGCAAGLMDVQTPYLVISRPRQALPEEQNKYTGYPSFITEQIGDLEGYTEVQMIHLENMTCTDEEYQEIDTLLLGGVII